ncbi:cytochrome c biogenesis protein CcsA [Desulfothermus okinawensis JCM 13304]
MKKNFSIETTILIMSFISIIVGIYFIYVYAPVEKVMGIPQKIFYFHVSFAWWSFFAFFLVCVYSFLYILKRDSNYLLWSISAAEIGVLYSTLVLITGIIWAKASWNTYWTWDPRLITTLIMWFMYVIYLVIVNMDIQEDKKYILGSGVGIIGFLDVPLVFWSARMWRSIHPAIFASKGGGMPREMLQTMFINLIAYGFLFLYLFLFRKRQLTLKDKLEQIIKNKIF